MHEKITFMKSVGSDRRGKIHTMLALSSVHTILYKKGIGGKLSEKERTGKVDVCAKG